MPYVPVDESKRVIFADAKIKSFDFLVYPSPQHKWIVDVKGRLFPYRDKRGRGTRYYENWVTQGDIQSLKEWHQVFGQEFEPQFVFAYLLQGPPDRWPGVEPHLFREESYAFFAVSLADYAAQCRPRSASWDTVAVPGQQFRSMLKPIIPV